MSSNRLYLTACGIINALGNNNSTVFNNLIKGDISGVVPWDIKVYDKTVYVGQINAELPPVPDSLKQYDCRNNQIMLAAMQQIENEVDVLKQKYPLDRIAVILGSSTSGIFEGENALLQQRETGVLPQEFNYRQQEIGTPALFLRAFLGLQGLAYTVSTACSSSAKVFASAKRLINSGLCDAAIVGGVDSLCRLTLNGFSSLESVSAGHCNPMSANRDGINIGEAAALFIVSRDESAIELLGVGESSDAYHMSAPDPNGNGAERSMRAALADAGKQPEDIEYINMHGTATPLNDEMESLAIERVFGCQTPVSSTKPLVGHTLGAAGATEVGFCWLLLNQSGDSVFLPPHRWDQAKDDKLPPIHLVSDGQELKFRANGAMISNSFAFGGNNASVIIARNL